MSGQSSQNHARALGSDGSTSTLTVLYDGNCPLCLREIGHVRGLAERRGENTLCFVDISNNADIGITDAERARLMARFHVQKEDGSRIDGAAAFVAMWERLPGWRWIARIARIPGALPLLELAYRGFLRIRPRLQAAARRFDARKQSPIDRQDDP